MERYSINTQSSVKPSNSIYSVKKNGSNKKSHTMVKQRKQLKNNSFAGSTLRQYLILLILICLGVISGSFYLKSIGVTKSFLDSTGFFMQDILCQQATSNNFFSLAISAFCPIAILICISFLFGLCAVGMPFEIIVIMAFGFWTGGCLTSVYLRFGLKGLGISLIFILPQTIINTLAILVSSREGLKMSSLMSKVLFKNETQKFDKLFQKYCYKYIVCFLLVIVSSLIEAAAIKIFALIFFS